MDRHRASRTDRTGSRRRPTALLMSAGLAAMLLTGGAGPSAFGSTAAAPLPQDPTCIESEQGGCLPIAPESERVDLAEPSFSDPTDVTNPLFPISELHSALLLGNVEGDPLRIEVTLLPETKTIEWNGQQIETLVSQFVAYPRRAHPRGRARLVRPSRRRRRLVLRRGRLQLRRRRHRRYRGHLACRPGRPARDDHARPTRRSATSTDPRTSPGSSSRRSPSSESARPSTARAVRSTVRSSSRSCTRTGCCEDKTFAPGYGEFISRGGSDLEALALAVPTDALAGPLPAELATLTTGAADHLRRCRRPRTGTRHRPPRRR